MCGFIKNTYTCSQSGFVNLSACCRLVALRPKTISIVFFPHLLIFSCPLKTRGGFGGVKLPLGPPCGKPCHCDPRARLNLEAIIIGLGNAVSWSAFCTLWDEETEQQ